MHFHRISPTCVRNEWNGKKIVLCLYTHTILSSYFIRNTLIKQTFFFRYHYSPQGKSEGKDISLGTEVI